MSSISAGKQVANGDPTLWHRWCRLCAHEHPTNRTLYTEEDQPNSQNTTLLAMTIGKYFWVDIKREDALSNYLCSECFTLMDCLINFSDRVRKVQIVFNRLQSLNPENLVNYPEIRKDCGLENDEWKHMISRTVEAHLMQKEEGFVDEVGAIAENEITTDEVEEQILVIPQLVEKEEHFQSKEAIINELDVVQEELEISRTNEEQEILEESEYLAEEEVETVEEEIDEAEALETSESLIEVDHIPEEDYIEESQIIEESQVEDFHVETYELLSQAEQSLKEKETEESTESETDTQDDSIPDNLVKDVEDIPAEPVIYTCHICNKPYKKPMAYKRHMVEVHDTEARDLPRLECNQCGQCFLTATQMASHYKCHLPSTPKPDNSCIFCKKLFTTPGTLKRHIEGVHKKIKPYVCDLCGKSFNYVTGLKDHKLVHTEECPFECPVCKRRFKNLTRLKIHSDTHSDKIYECTICGVKLKTRRTFNKHKLVHSDERQFKCDVCGSAFKRSKTLKAHLILHTGIRPYKCNFCGRDFSNGSNCRSHKRQAHPKELAEEESRGVSRSILLPMLNELTKASKLIKTPARPSKTKGSRPKVSTKEPESHTESPTKETDGAILYELVEELDYS
ncbi:zinc finger protein weckle [Drosophila eugracilis]|uniref:zinc finger protein weckle n=1 Tax=Drosophila eugracilis TaxID=29029 RepID=UPI001BDA7AE5|nr:zinc finger protein weckle [Drosophila eugracilis]